MRIIFSRKGFDSSAGRVPSPVFEDGSMVSLPIPEPQPVSDDACYADISAVGTTLGAIVEGLTSKRIATDRAAHLDPDLRRDARERRPGWRPLFGQDGAAQSHLERQSVGRGDLFLFFGWFRHASRRDDQFRFTAKGSGFHALFGWLQVDEMRRAGPGASLPPWAAGHPHAVHDYGSRNVLYVSTPELKINGASLGVPGAGTFDRLTPELLLSACDPASGTIPRRSRWSLPSCFCPQSGPMLSYHRAAHRWTRDTADPHRVLLDVVSRGQEFIFDASECPEAVTWATRLILEHGSRGASVAAD